MWCTNSPTRRRARPHDPPRDPRRAAGGRNVFIEAEGGLAPADICDFAALAPGNLVVGPAVIHTPITMIAVQAAQTARMDPYRNIVIAFD